jgi:hypothetical protein
MSLDLVKNALFQRLRTNLPDLIFLPDEDWTVDPKTLGTGNPALLTFVEIHTEKVTDIPQQEAVIAMVGGAEKCLPVLGYFETTWRLQLRQQPGPNRSIAQIRETSAELLRDLMKLRALSLGPQSSIAAFWVVRTRQDKDDASKAHLDEITQRVEWKLVDTVSAGLPVYRANEIDVYLNGQLLVEIP